MVWGRKRWTGCCGGVLALLAARLTSITGELITHQIKNNINELLLHSGSLFNNLTFLGVYLGAKKSNGEVRSSAKKKSPSPCLLAYRYHVPQSNLQQKAQPLAEMLATGGQATWMVFQRIWGRHLGLKVDSGIQFPGGTVTGRFCTREETFACSLAGKSPGISSDSRQSKRARIEELFLTKRPTPCSRLPSCCPFQEERRATS